MILRDFITSILSEARVADIGIARMKKALNHWRRTGRVIDSERFQDYVTNHLDVDDWEVEELEDFARMHRQLRRKGYARVSPSQGVVNIQRRRIDDLVQQARKYVEMVEEMGYFPDYDVSKVIEMDAALDVSDISDDEKNDLRHILGRWEEFLLKKQEESY